jgi:hypothetical protein
VGPGALSACCILTQNGRESLICVSVPVVAQSLLKIHWKTSVSILSTIYNNLIDPFLYIVAVEGQFDVMVTLNVHAVRKKNVSGDHKTC